MPFLGVKVGEVSEGPLSCRGRVGVVTNQVGAGVEARQT